ncbi:cytidylate kinase, putative [Methanococcus vannielii SB]|jgi:cytidylate kinase|uniref:Cytidylate kinase n=1 Tax=Methanococcus vannielii (strain ATCC 35089 / DSM 1224 / JCM 13029 / OCM 148 / SB) TaxID=406327 RepID=KCY_METVS|nr:AAA family ATPase [Methanococcus vannielii]A6USC1.1 RecName: Full=Cytidylate kinase; Short=CK; AltName: Full=Cytidine monophosphate kinase; Short=CMP kinase [Methanococcus vannielii SB]ABR55393.1 cytidylate kinase, putative [Methanococcus vannielii SB]
MIITIGGLPGTGTTTISKLLSEKYGLSHVCAGFIFRDMAKENNMTLQEFSNYAEKNSGVDNEIDRRQVEAAKSGNLILEGRLAGWILKKNDMVPDLSIWLKADPMVRCKRISEREHENVDLALEKMLLREASEKKRYKEIYNIEIDDLSIYDLVIESSKWGATGVFNIIEKAIK